MNFLSVLFFLCIFVYDCTSFRNRNDHLCSVLENTHKSYYNNQYHFCRKWNRRRSNKSRLETSSSNRGGKNGAASNDGILIKWEKVSGELISVADTHHLSTLRLGPEEEECSCEGPRGRVLPHGHGQRIRGGGQGAVGQAGALQGQWGHP